jgi:hypothetical protein
MCITHESYGYPKNSLFVQEGNKQVINQLKNSFHAIFSLVTKFPKVTPNSPEKFMKGDAIVPHFEIGMIPNTTTNLSC